MPPLSSLHAWTPRPGQKEIDVATCPITGKAAPSDVMFCAEAPSSTICSCCPAYSWRVRLYWFWRGAFWRVSLLLSALLALCVLTVAPASADHNPAHDCPSAVAQAVLQGRMGGSFYANADGTVATWTNGAYVCIFRGGEAKTLFKSRNAAQYVAKDAAKKGLQPVSQGTAERLVGTARKLAGQSGSNLLGLGLRPSLECVWMQPRNGRGYWSCPQNW